MDKRQFPIIFRIVQVLVFITFSSVFSGNEFYRIQYLSQTEQQLRFQVEFDSINVIQKKVENTWYSVISADGCPMTAETGKPRLPFVGLTLGIPASGTPVLRVTQEKSISQPVTNLEMVSDDSENNLALLASGYTQYPAGSAAIEQVGFFRQQRVLQLKLYPVRYQPGSGTLSIASSMIIEINFQRDKTSLSKTTSVLSVGGSDPQAEHFYTQIMDNAEPARQWRVTPNTMTTAQVNSITAPYRYKLLVEQDGIYAVTGQELIDAGADLNTIAPNTLTLYNRDQKLPILVEGDGDGHFDAADRIIFAGSHNPGDDTWLSLFSETNVYWLTWGSGTGARYARMSGAPDLANPDTLDVAPVTIHLEQDLLYDRLVSMPDTDADHWFWKLMEDGLEYDIPIPGPGNSGLGPLRIKAAFQGLTHTAVTPDHHVLIKYNQQIVDEATWDNQTPYLFDSGNLYLSQGGTSHSVSFNLPGDLANVAIDRIYLNWVEVSYTQPLQATHDSLSFNSSYQPNSVLRMSGFAAPGLYLLTNTGTQITDIKTVRNGDDYSFIFADHSSVARTFYAASEKGLKSVTGIQPTSETNLRNRSNGADYIVITHHDFAEQAQQLVDLRSGQGLRAISVDIQDIFDEFSAGLYDPRAIKYFLQYAWANWQKPAPLYVLLMGDVTHELDKQVARNENYPTFVPTFMEYTQTWGMSSSDNYFAAIVGDDELPDLFLGRLPVNTPEQAEIMVSKTIAHESEYTPGEWRRHLLMLTGVDPFFEASARDIYTHHTPDYMITDRVATLDTSRYLGSTEDVADLINSGQSILNFIGHGGGSVFSDAELFLTEDIERLSNHNKYPFVFSLTCFIGYFDNPELPSLAESLLSAPDKGIVGSFGSSGRAFLQGDYYLNNAIFDAVFKKDLRTYGAVATLGKLEMVNQTQGFWAHVKSYNLMGDPALKLYIPEDKINVELSNQTLANNQDLQVTGSISGQTTGDITVTVYNDFDSLLATKNTTLNSGTFSVNAINLNSSVRSAWGANGGRGRVRVYFSHGQQEAAGAADFSVGRPYVSSLYTFPEQPKHNTPFFFVAALNRADMTATLGQVDSLMIYWSTDEEQWNILGLYEQTAGYWRTDTTLTLTEGTDVFYTVKALVNGQVLPVSDTRTVQVAYRPDIYPDASSLMIYGEQQTLISITIKNRGFEPSGPFTVNLYRDPGDGNLEAIGDTLTMTGLEGNASTQAAFVWGSPTPGKHKLICIVDEAGTVAESDERNNQVSVTTGVATKANGTSGELYDDTRRYYVKIPANGLNKNSSINFENPDDNTLLQAAQSLQLEPVIPIGDSTWSAFAISLADSSVMLQQDYTAAAFYDPDDSLTSHYLATGALKLYAWNSNTGTWIGLVGTVNTQEHLLAATSATAYRTFALMGSGDIEAPAIQIGVEGQNFADGDMVSKNPVFTVLMTDSSGFDTESQPVSISLDSQPVTDDQISLYRNDEQKRQMTATFTPELTSGSHVLSVTARDINGNSRDSEVTFEIASEFALEAIANHPNPFVDETVIAFTLADAADEVKLDIYTVSGRLIRSFSFTDISGYVEQDWDGLDEEGREVANGVYYLRFTAKQGDKRIEQIEKMARLK